MITYKTGNIFDEDNLTTLVNPVNCVGVMGKGLALEFRKKFPTMMKTYKKLCDAGDLRPGRLANVKDGYYTILLFPTKDHWSNPSKYEYIEKGLRTFNKAMKAKKLAISRIAFPPLGCGLGGLEWAKVKMLMEKYLSDLDIECVVYEKE